MAWAGVTKYIQRQEFGDSPHQSDEDHHCRHYQNDYETSFLGDTIFHAE